MIIITAHRADKKKKMFWLKEDREMLIGCLICLLLTHRVKPINLQIKTFTIKYEKEMFNFKTNPTFKKKNFK